MVIHKLRTLHTPFAHLGVNSSLISYYLRDIYRLRTLAQIFRIYYSRSLSTPPSHILARDISAYNPYDTIPAAPYTILRNISAYINVDSRGCDSVQPGVKFISAFTYLDVRQLETVHLGAKFIP